MDRVIYDTDADDIIYAGELDKEGIAPNTTIYLSAGNNTVYCQDAIAGVHITTAGRTDTIYHGTSILKLFVDACASLDDVTFHKVDDSLKLTFSHTEDDTVSYGNVILDGYFSKIQRSDYINVGGRTSDSYQGRNIARKLTEILINENSETVSGTRFVDTVTLNEGTTNFKERFRANVIICDNAGEIVINKSGSEDTLKFVEPVELSFEHDEDDLVISWATGKITLKDAYVKQMFIHNAYRILNGDTEIILKDKEL